MRIVGGKWRGRQIEAPEGRGTTRPTTDRTREAVASMVLSARGLDLSGDAVLDAFEPGDHLLDWQDGTSLRYCHHFEEDEINRLIAALPAGTVRAFERYWADGRAGNLNRYVLLRRTSGSEPNMKA